MPKDKKESNHFDTAIMNKDKRPFVYIRKELYQKLLTKGKIKGVFELTIDNLSIDCIDSQ